MTSLPSFATVWTELDEKWPNQSWCELLVLKSEAPGTCSKKETTEQKQMTKFARGRMYLRRSMLPFAAALSI
jgi:hypothetical protein